MPFQEDFEEFLDTEQGFASVATITPGLGRPYKIKGIFSNNYYEFDAASAGISGSQPVFECAVKDLINIEYGDFLELEDTNYPTHPNYRITTVKPDTNGWVVMLLEKQD